MVGMILIGLARCSLLWFLFWNDLAEEAVVTVLGLVALNSIFSSIAYSFYAWIFITVLPPIFDFDGAFVDISIATIAESRSHLFREYRLHLVSNRSNLVKLKGENGIQDILSRPYTQ